VWEAKDSSLILSAYDHGREEPRSFRLDRIIRTYDAPDVEYVEIERRQS
jgi:predicted DNA-binding transcriptional regulator YafY